MGLRKGAHPQVSPGRGVFEGCTAQHCCYSHTMPVMLWAEVASSPQQHDRQYNVGSASKQHPGCHSTQ